MRFDLRNLSWVLIWFSCPSLAQLPNASGVGTAPDDWLMGNGRAWHYRTNIAKTPSELNHRSPNAAETFVVERAKFLLENRPAKALALVQGREVVWTGYKSPEITDKRFFSFSVGKTVAAIAMGKAICSGKLTLQTQVAELVPELKGTDLADSKLKDILTMTSGTWEGNADATVFSSQQENAINNGELSYLQILSTEKVSSAHKGIFGAKRKPGEVFSYRNTDALLAGVMLSRATGVDYVKYIEREVLIPAGIETRAIVGQDQFGYGQSDSGIRLTLPDWIRFAVWVNESMHQQDCFGRYLSEAATTKVDNKSKKFGKLFDGYGYFIWTKNNRMGDSFWAVGHGGQRIAWNKMNDRILIAFSNEESYMDDLYSLYRDWATLP
jgi:CubicO group peptidase (beta-lactamase class C family)